MPASDWLGAAISGATGLLTAAITSNQNKQLAKGQANSINSQNLTAYAVEMERTKQAQLAYQAALASTQGGVGGNTTLYIVLAVTGVLVLGGVAYAVTRKK